MCSFSLMSSRYLRNSSALGRPLALYSPLEPVALVEGFSMCRVDVNSACDVYFRFPEPMPAYLLWGCTRMRLH